MYATVDLNRWRGAVVKGTHTLSSECMYMYISTYKKPPCSPAWRIFLFTIPPPPHSTVTVFFPLCYQATWKLRDPRSGKIQNLVARIHTHSHMYEHIYLTYTHMHTLTRRWRRTWDSSGGEFKVKKSPEGAEEPESWLDL